MTTRASISDSCNGAVKRETVPSYSFALFQADGVRKSGFGGFRQLVPERIPAKPEDIFDVASLTKPIITATAYLIARQRGLIDFSLTLGDVYGDRCPEDKLAISVCDLLTHRSGLPDWEPLYCHGRERNQLIAAILEGPLRFPVGQRSLYSCLGYILLWDCYERIAGQSLEGIARAEILEPLGMNRSYLRPHDSLKELIVPTELGTNHEMTMAKALGRKIEQCEMRQDLIHGQVHDGNAFALGGFAGNAGLFSTAVDIARFGMMLLRSFQGQNEILTRDSVTDMVTEFSRNDTERTSIGWQLPTASWSGGPLLSQDSIGHTGFTGCGLWIDVKNNFGLVLLTNRIHPSVADVSAVRQFRQETISAANETIFMKKEKSYLTV